MIREVEDHQPNIDKYVDSKMPPRRTGVLRTLRHEHKFIIPVEWGYDTGRQQVDYSDGKTRLMGYLPDRKRVTKLLCECGKERERK